MRRKIAFSFWSVCLSKIDARPQHFFHFLTRERFLQLTHHLNNCINLLNRQMGGGAKLSRGAKFAWNQTKMVNSKFYLKITEMCTGKGGAYLTVINTGSKIVCPPPRTHIFLGNLDRWAKWVPLQYGGAKGFVFPRVFSVNDFSFVT
jgi:hypothetical protein